MFKIFNHLELTVCNFKISNDIILLLLQARTFLDIIKEIKPNFFDISTKELAYYQGKHGIIYPVLYNDLPIGLKTAKPGFEYCLVREKNVLTRLHDVDGIVQLIDIPNLPDKYVAIEWIDGIILRDFLERLPKNDESLKVKIEIIKNLFFIIERCIERDVYPFDHLNWQLDNMLVTNGYTKIILIDFGSAAMNLVTYQIRSFNRNLGLLAYIILTGDRVIRNIAYSYKIRKQNLNLLGLDTSLIQLLLDTMEGKNTNVIESWKAFFV